MAAFVVLAAGVLGLIFGSFASMLAYRLPRKLPMGGRERSRCPACDAQLTARENIPVASYLAQRGRCRHCGARIPSRYPLIEGATGLLFALAAWKFGPSGEAVVFAGFFFTLVVLTVIDLEHLLLPNRIVYPAFIAGWIALSLLALATSEVARLGDAALGALIFGGFFTLVAFIYPAGMGGGDVKLAFVLGTFLGWLGVPGVVLVGMFLSFVLGALGGIITAAATGGGRKTAVPFGPFLALGAVLAVFLGAPIAETYSSYL
ncbi:A24 family peptidase [soil metagenome]